ncbi:hypothetical protein ACO0K7_08565 [Undibacterium sp. Ji67W]|uniref:hypothetical protein n=1 Tax=Undibacterium sp. Ji67W TaxID=3413042 RepID=UPI003BF27652
MQATVLIDSKEHEYFYEFSDTNPTELLGKKEVPILQKGEKVSILAIFYSGKSNEYFYFCENPKRVAGVHETYFVLCSISDLAPINPKELSDWEIKSYTPPISYHGDFFDIEISHFPAYHLIRNN